MTKMNKKINKFSFLNILTKIFFIFIIIVLLIIFVIWLSLKVENKFNNNVLGMVYSYKPLSKIETIEIEDKFMSKLVDTAIERTNYKVRYDPAYIQIDYPMGDVPDNTGVCSDVIIRSYRGVGIDLQEKIHEDMSNSFEDYPARWGLKSVDSNIDHRRVPNLMVFFEKKNASLEISDDYRDYLPGDLVVWDFGGGKRHIGIVTNRVLSDSRRPLIVHNSGLGPKLNDVLFAWNIMGHFRYYGD